MHDAEDVIHPLALRLYSRLIPEHDFVQTPVFSLPLPKGKFVAGTYIDEFAEHHLKDMLVREAIGGMVPSAGVGSGFARDAFEEIAGAHGQKPFNPESLTEDYEIGLKFRLAGKKVHFALHTVERQVEVPGLVRAAGARRSRRSTSPPGSTSPTSWGPRCGSARAGSWASRCRPGPSSAGRARWRCSTTSTAIARRC